jgi:hypothetical protein
LFQSRGEEDLRVLGRFAEEILSVLKKSESEVAHHQFLSR